MHRQFQPLSASQLRQRIDLVRPLSPGGKVACILDLFKNGNVLPIALPFRLFTVDQIRERDERDRSATIDPVFATPVEFFRCRS